jgi:hypothetical protein
MKPWMVRGEASIESLSASVQLRRGSEGGGEAAKGIGR